METSKRLIATPTRTAEIMKQYDIKMKKSLGQNFLVEPSILDKMIQTADITKNTTVIEIGPGIGALTEFLALSAKEVLAFEIDPRFVKVLANTLSEYDNVNVVHEDILKVNFNNPEFAHLKEAEDLVVVANLPYYITTPIMMHLLMSDLDITSMTVMMQKEVADRISAVPGTKAYGSLSIAVQYYMDAKLAFIVPKTAFVPQPNIDSAILHLTKRDEPIVKVLDEDFFFTLTKSAFTQRRKTLWNNLTSHFGKDEQTKEWLETALAEVGIDPKRRGETLSIQEFGDLANVLITNKK